LGISARVHPGAAGWRRGKTGRMGMARHVAIACVLWILCGAYATRFVYRGWVAHDEGTIGQSAERVLSGELPHRDFDEVYTGGLTYLHAAGMTVFGVNLRAPRLILFAFFMAFLAAAYAIARRVGSPPAALVAMALITVWSVPNYFVSLPSWYNLFFATFGVLALLTFLETQRRRWLVLAGVCGGLSLLMKIAGIFYLAGGLLFLSYVEQAGAAAAAQNRPQRSRFWVIVAMPSALCLLLLLSLLWSKSEAPEILTVFGPALAVCLFVVWREGAAGTGAIVYRLSRVFRLVWPFAAGAAAPLVLFGLLYWHEGATAALFRGVFILPLRRLTEASMNPPSIVTLGLGVPYAAVLLMDRRLPILAERLLTVVVVIVLGATLAYAHHPAAYRASWAIARSLPLISVMVGLWVLRREGPSAELSAPKRAHVFLLITMAAMVALVQFPYATPTYFCYAAPMTVLAIVALVSAQPRAPVRLHVGVAAFFFLFAVVFVNRSYGWNLGVQFIPYAPASRLDLERGGLWVPAEDKDTYERIAAIVRQHAVGGAIYAGPDCPEVYFLSGFKNPTRAIFDFLTPVQEDEAWMADLLSRAPIRAAVINTAPLFSARLDAGAQTLLERRFPSFLTVGRFVVRFE